MPSTISTSPRGSGHVCLSLNKKNLVAVLNLVLNNDCVLESEMCFITPELGNSRHTTHVVMVTVYL